MTIRLSFLGRVDLPNPSKHKRDMLHHAKTGTFSSREAPKLTREFQVNVERKATMG